MAGYKGYNRLFNSHVEMCVMNCYSGGFPAKIKAYLDPPTPPSKGSVMDPQ